MRKPGKLHCGGEAERTRDALKRIAREAERRE
jgi:hypothetical protein